MNHMNFDHLVKNLNRYSFAYRTRPVHVFEGRGTFSFSVDEILKFCMIADATMNKVFLANVSPAQSLLPAPNGNDLSNLGDNFPRVSKNRSGLNRSGRFHVSSSKWDPIRDPKTIAPCRIAKLLILKKE